MRPPRWTLVSPVGSVEPGVGVLPDPPEDAPEPVEGPDPAEPPEPPEPPPAPPEVPECADFPVVVVPPVGGAGEVTTRCGGWLVRTWVSSITRPAALRPPKTMYWASIWS